MRCELSNIHPPEDPLRANIDDLAILELAQSLSQLGQLQPIGVAPHPTLTGDWLLIYGHRRYLAARSLNWTHIDATEVTGTDKLRSRRLVENTQREQLTPIEEAHALTEVLTDHGDDVVAAARTIGKTRAWVRSRLSMLDWPEELQAAVHEELITQGVARHLATIDDPEIRAQYLTHAISSGCTTANAAQWAQTANLASQGVAAAQLADDLMEANAIEPQVVHQLYTCFACRTQSDFKRVNLLVICAPCQSALIEVRDQTNTAPE